MLQAVLLQCKPRARFHFGEVAPDNNTSLNATSEWLHSDTLFSAIVNTLADLYPQNEVSSLVQHFESGDIAISSGFYCLMFGEKPVWFLPKPAHYGLDVKGEFKDYNRVKLISKSVWESGVKFDDWANEGFLFLQNGYAVATDKELDGLACDKALKIKLFEESDAPRVKVHGIDQQDAFFYLTYIGIRDTSHQLKGSSAHFYFLLKTQNGFEKKPEYQKILTALNLLPAQGIGGERTAGYGQLTGIKFYDFEMPQNGAHGYASLSLAMPKKGELSKFDRYQIIARGGRNYGGGQKILEFRRMLAEGAFSKNQPDGEIPPIGKSDDGIPFLRYGKPFWMPVCA